MLPRSSSPGSVSPNKDLGEPSTHRKAKPPPIEIDPTDDEEEDDDDAGVVKRRLPQLRPNVRPSFRLGAKAREGVGARSKPGNFSSVQGQFLRGLSAGHSSSFSLIQLEADRWLFVIVT